MSAAPQDTPNYRGLTPPAREQAILKLHAEGKSDYEIAEACGINRRAIYDVRHKHQLKPNGGKYAPRKGAAANFVKAWKPPPQSEAPAAPPPDPWRLDDDVDRTHGWRAADGRWWTGMLRADKGPLLTAYASFAKRFGPNATFSGTMKKLGFQPDGKDEKKHPHGEFYGLELRRLEDDA